MVIQLTPIGFFFFLLWPKKEKKLWDSLETISDMYTNSHLNNN